MSWCYNKKQLFLYIKYYCLILWKIQLKSNLYYEIIKYNNYALIEYFNLLL